MRAVDHSRVMAVILLTAAVLIAVACSRSNPGGAKRYQLKGKIVSIDKQSGMLNVDSEDIPGFMAAMTMPYAVKPATELNRLSTGDSITADVVLQKEDYWLENVKVTGHSSAPPKPASEVHIPAAGDVVPDFQLTNQSGKRISIDEYRGRTLILTFIYTRCPFPDYCPRVSGEFAEIHRQLRADETRYRKTHLLSISIDPEHDTPKILREYGWSVAGSKESGLFEHWEFAVPRASDLPRIASYFGLTYAGDDGVITHSLSTAVIGPDGKIFKWYHGNEWRAADLLKDAADLLHTVR